MEGEWKAAKQEVSEANYDAVADAFDRYYGTLMPGDVNFSDDELPLLRGVQRFASGNVYEGELKAGKAEGRGIMRFASGSVYDGEWKAGKQEGRGVTRFASGNVYEGEYKAGEKEGRGIFRYAGGSVYDGEWKAGKQEGRGVMRHANGDVYDGEYKAGKAEGRGICRYAGGNVYDGEWKAGKEEGRGVERHANGDVYDGEIKAGKAEGRGIFRFASGAVYEGDFKAGAFEGRGVVRLPVYDGQWKLGLPIELPPVENEGEPCVQACGPSPFSLGGACATGFCGSGFCCRRGWTGQYGCGDAGCEGKHCCANIFIYPSSPPAAPPAPPQPPAPPSPPPPPPPLAHEPNVPMGLPVAVPVGEAKVVTGNEMVGRRVRAVKLTVRPEFNGCVGTVRSWDQSRGRYIVQLDAGGLNDNDICAGQLRLDQLLLSGQDVTLKRENLKIGL